MTILSADIFKRATAVAVKAIGHKAELEIGFSNVPLPDSGTRVSIPEPPPVLTRANLGAARGAADAAALRLRYHDERLHAMKAPPTREARANFDMLEQARYEALGARAMKGVALNLSSAIEAEGHHDEKTPTITQEERPLAQALRLMAWEKLTGARLPPDAARAVEVWRVFIEERAGAHWRKLSALLDDQKAYAAEALRLIADLDKNAPGEDERDKEEKAATPAEEDFSDESQSDTQEKQGVSGQDEEEQKSEDGGATGDAAPLTEGANDEGDAPVENTGAQGNEETDAPLTTYRAFTTQFDEIVAAMDLCHADELTRLRLMLDRQVSAMQSLIVRLANRLQRRLMAQQARHWEFDLEEGLLDAARLARVVVSPTHALSYKREKPMDFRDTVVTLLIDNSGSMRGRPITLAAMSADILARTLERCGVKVEILGFTTRAWKGGLSRDAWVKAGKPVLPGRLE